jgi:glucose-1-phosphate adenylyltransferase
VADPRGLDLYDLGWRVYSFQRCFPPPRGAVAPEPPGRPAGGPAHNIFANGTVAGGWLRGAVVGFDCRIDQGAVVEDSILFDGVSVGRGAEVRRAILEKGVRVLPGARVGFDPGLEQERGFVVSEAGVTCVPKGVTIGGD